MAKPVLNRNGTGPTPPPEPRRHWHAESVETVLAAVEATPEGLTQGAAEARLARHGPNRLTPPRSRGALARLLAQFHNVLIYVLLVAAAVTAGLGHWTDSAVIAAVVVVNAVIGFIQEGRAERALSAIRDLLSLHATALRDGRRVTVAAEALVAGDIVLIESGDKVPADLRLIGARTLRVQEAVLTGESVPVDKARDPVGRDAPLGDRASMAFSGTLVTYGQGTGVVVATGDATEIGRIGTLLAGTESLTTPLLRQMAVFGRWLTAGILGLAAVTFAVGTVGHGFTAGDMFLAAVGLAVAAIPEGLPAIMTVTLAIGVERMARRNAIIRRLPAVETLGSVSVICSDKTGTFTRNEMMVESIATSRHMFAVAGDGYAPAGEFSLDGVPVDLAAHPRLETLARGAILCSDADLSRDGEAWRIEGDPMEAALVVVGMKANLDPDRERDSWPRSDLIPFDSGHRFMATLHHDRSRRGVVFVKGAPESVLPMCSRQGEADGAGPIDLAYWHGRMDEITRRGQRVLALAMKDTGPDHHSLGFADLGSGLTLLGLFGFGDPPREEAIEAVAKCRAAGIRVKMITGDHAGTARAIAQKLGLRNALTVVTGTDLDRMDDEELAEHVIDVDVFARTTPEHKLRLVEALQARRRIVAMTGDGVNDAPALKRADVGIAMGRKGSEAAKEAAEMVLADDNFASIAHAVEEGRTVYDNLKKAILFILPTNGGEALTIVAAIALGRLLPITAVQILWINMITAVTLALALAFEPAEAEVMKRPPRDAREPILSGFVLWRIALVSLVLVAGVFGIFVWLRDSGADIETARTAAVNTLVLFEAFYLFNVRRMQSSAFASLFDRNAWIAWAAVATVVSFQLLFTYAPFMQTLFQSRPLAAYVWLAVLGVAAIIFLIVELEKTLLRALRRRTG